MSATSCIPALYGQALYTLHRLQHESCDEVRAPLKRIAALLTTAMALLLLPALALTDESTTLQTIMQGLRDNLVEITDGLLTDDLELVERGATGIATHPRIPPEQVQLIARELGEEMPAFKQFDMRVHDLAVEIGAATRLPYRRIWPPSVSRFEYTGLRHYYCRPEFLTKSCHGLRKANSFDQKVTEFTIRSKIVPLR
jgi:hypothetical protein